MRLADIVLGGALLAVTGCATGRPYSSGAAPGGSSGPSVPNITPNLGNPADTPTGSSGSSFNRGRGPALRMPEASRSNVPSGKPRILSRWQPTAPSRKTSHNRPDAPPTSTSTLDRPGLPNGLAWERVHRSTDRRAIETLKLGTGSQRIALLGSLHGDEAQSVALVDELARYLASHPTTIKHATVLLVKSPNPDGLSARSPYNVHGVDLNRNFPTSNWKSLQNARAGGNSGSEVETRAVVRVLEDFKPMLLVHLKDSRDQAVVNSEGNVESQARKIAALLHGQAVKGLGAKTSGSMEQYAAMKLACPSLTILLAVAADDRTAWTKNRDALLAAIGTTPPLEGETSARDDEVHPFDRAAVSSSSLQQETTAPSRSSTPSTNLSNARRSSSRSNLPDFPTSIPERGYVELPPP